MPFFTKKPVTIEAIQWTGDNFDEISNFIGDHHGHKKAHEDAEERAIRTGEYYIRTLEDVMTASKGDWIIKGVKGEFYPCKPDIFEITYSPTNHQNSSSGVESAGVKQLLEDFLDYVGGNFTQHGTGDDVYWDRGEGEDRQMNYEGVVEDYLFDYSEFADAVLSSTKSVSAVESAGVWVKASERVPVDSNLVHLRYGIKRPDFKLTAYFEPTEQAWHRQDGGLLAWTPDLEWLDESAAASFEPTIVMPGISSDPNFGELPGAKINLSIPSSKEVEAIEILKALVGLKELKDSRGKTEYYLLAQPVAWERAKQYLESLNKKP